MDGGTEPLFPYKHPVTRKGIFRKHEYVYDGCRGCYLRPNGKILSCSATGRDGYREYKGRPEECGVYPHLTQCTNSRNHQKVVTRHVWEEYMEKAEDIHHTLGNEAIYQKRKEAIERTSGTAKESHGFRYTQMYGKAAMRMKAELTFAYMNLKKLAYMLGRGCVTVHRREKKVQRSRKTLHHITIPEEMQKTHLLNDGHPTDGFVHSPG